ncbi:MAG: cobyric acid synthase [Nitrospinota bacterium]|nr:cobyric acid synthase [Nitrospinota bacterium]
MADDAGLPHGGNLTRLAAMAGARREDILDFSANVNPLGFPEWLRPVISSAISSLAHYPDPMAESFTQAVAQANGVAPPMVVAGNGATELLSAAASMAGIRRAVIPAPAYVDYRACAQRAGLEVETLAMEESRDFALDLDRLSENIGGGEIVFIGSPNNPNGLTAPRDELLRLALARPDTIFVVDESFGGFVEDFESVIGASMPENMIAVVSLTKLFAIPGLRLGYAVARPGLAGAVSQRVPPWSVNALAQAVGVEAVEDKEYARRTKEAVRALREELAAGLENIPGLKVYPARANYLLLRLESASAADLAQRLITREKIAIRVCHNFEGLDGRYFRLAVRSKAENAQLLEALSAQLGAKAPAIRLKRKTPALMFQGVSSNSGKSVLTAAICRIMKQDGHDVAPFKAQNMALNSYVTLDGREIGRAQVTQAQACGLEPDTRMNPILLKPNSDTGSQVILLGKPVGSMTARDYYGFKSQAFDTVKQAYDSISAQHGVMVIEGAGSPGEVNLKKHDIVNMRMAEYAGAPVVIVGDIDRGGVFASFVGIMETLAEWERKLTAGFVINKFRGDKSLLDEAMDYTRRHTGLPTFGVVPYIHELGLPEEDQAPIRPNNNGWGAATVRVAALRLRHVSNFTDFDPLMMEPDVQVRSVTRPEELEGADVVIIPGSKNVIGDLAVLKESGLFGRLQKIAAGGLAPIVGICGGFQMLGRRISDPHGIESGAREAAGLGLMPVETTLEKEKTLKRAWGVHQESGLRVNGYEIHHGVTAGGQAPVAVLGDDGAMLGAASADGKAWGTYLHGIFNDDQFRRWFIDRLRERKGEPPLGAPVTRYDVDGALDRLAELTRANLDIPALYRLAGLR